MVTIYSNKYVISTLEYKHCHINKHIQIILKPHQRSLVTIHISQQTQTMQTIQYSMITMSHISFLQFYE